MTFDGWAVPSRRAFLVRAAAYVVFLVGLWQGLKLASGLTAEAWDRLVERPATARKPYLAGGGVHLGIYRPEAPLHLARLLHIERAVRKRFAVISMYQAWGSRPEHRFPARDLALIANAGYLPLLTWEPWTTEFDEERYGPRESRTYRSLRDVAAGRYDDFLHAWARDCMAWGKPLFLRFAHEMNNPRYPWSFATGNTAADFRAAWRHVWDLFEAHGCRNVAWVWTPLAGPEFEAYYPGELHVDWVGVAVLNYGLTWPPYRWWEFEDIFQTSYERLKALRKPILVAEAASVGESSDQGTWLVRALRSLRPTFPLVRLLVFFDAPNDTSRFKEGVPWTFSNRPSILSRLRRELASGWFRSGLARPAADPQSPRRH